MSDFHLLLEEEIPGLMRYASALTRDAEQAGELVEDTAIEALARRGERRRGDLRVWLLALLHEQRDNPFRRGTPSVGASDPIADPAAVLTLSDLDRALGQLPEGQRAAILLIGLEGMSYGQTAAILRISLGAMRSRLTRGRENLRRALGAKNEPRLARAA